VHRVPIEVVVIDDAAVDYLVSYAQGRHWTRPFVVMDANTEEVAGSRVTSALSSVGMAVRSFSYPERKGLLADELNVTRLEAALRKVDTDSIFSVGSGVITDLTRYVASRLGREFVSVPTAASMDGYASGVAVMEFGGMKTSYTAPPPIAIFAEPDTIASAPLDMTRAGIGDLLGKASARTDWVAAHCLYGEYLCVEVEKRVAEALLQTASHIHDILAGSPEAAGTFLSGLVESGIAIAMVGSSRPASGCEHQVSHFLDLLAANGRRAHAPHGLQVGYATGFAMRLQLHAFAGALSELSPPRPPARGDDEMRRLFAGHDTQVDEVMEQKRRFLAEHASRWPSTAARWAEVKERVGAPVAVFPVIAEALSIAGIPSEPGFLDLDAATLRTCFRWANRIRPRYTVLDFLEGQGRLDDAIDDLFTSMSPGS
jgi:glycerol-1-phosphate dehydrogenase [NAD(P)+]